MKEVILQEGDHISYTYTKKSITFSRTESATRRSWSMYAGTMTTIS